MRVSSPGRIAIASLLLALAVAASAAGAERLRIGTSGDYPPFSKDGEGFDVEVARLLARDLGVDVEWVSFRWPELATRLGAGDFDVAMSGITWRPERDVAGWMTRAVARSGPCVVGSESPVRIGVNRGGVLERWARSRFAPEAIVAVEDNLSLPARLVRGEIDALVTDRFEVRHFAPEGAAVRCEPARDRKVYWVGPGRARTLGPRIDRWLADHEAELARLRTAWLGEEGRTVAADHLVDLVGRRLELMPMVAAAKRKSGRTIEDTGREARVLDAVSSRAREAGLDPASVRRLYATLIDLAKAVQERSPPSLDTALRLAEDLRPALSRLDARIVAALGEATPLSAEALSSGRLDLLAATLDDAEMRRLSEELLAVRRTRPVPGSVDPESRGRGTRASSTCKSPPSSLGTITGAANGAAAMRGGLMSEGVTRGVRVSVESEYVPSRSDPDGDNYLFAYHVTIRNESDVPVQLISRHWIITDSSGKEQEVRGLGVVGKQPRLDPGEEFSYTSACPLTTPVGSMRGTYQMVIDGGEVFDAVIAPFTLAVPGVLQ